MKNNNELFNYHVTLEKLYEMLSEFVPNIRIDISLEKEDVEIPEELIIKLFAQRMADGNPSSAPAEELLLSYKTKTVKIDAEKIITDIATSEPDMSGVDMEEDIEKVIEDAINNQIIEAYYEALKKDIVGTGAILNDELRGLVNSCYELDRFSQTGGKIEVGGELKTATTGLEEFTGYLKARDLQDFPPEESGKAKN